MTATITPFPRPARPVHPAHDAALTELIGLGLAVARVASHLAAAEDHALDALADAAATAARALLAPAVSLADAMESGRAADASMDLRAATAARVASITDSFERAARAVRRTVALHARLAEDRPFAPARPPQAGPRAAAPSPDRPVTDAERADRPDIPESGDELGTRSDAQVLRDIHRDLADALAATPPGAPAAATPRPHRGSHGAPPAPAAHHPPPGRPDPDT